jgi:hypothetical protein
MQFNMQYLSIHTFLATSAFLSTIVMATNNNYNYGSTFLQRLGVCFLRPDEQLLLTGLSTLEVRNGPGVQFYAPLANHAQKRKATLLNERQYVVVTDNLTGAMRVENGPQLFFAHAYDHFSTPQAAYELQKYQYVKLLDEATGEVRVERGESIVFPKANEVAISDDKRSGHDGNEKKVQDAINVDNETAVLVRSKETGQQRLVQEKGLFFPGPYEEILDVRSLIYVQPYEVAVVRDNKGDYSFYSGAESAESATGHTFFLPPYCELVTMMWSSGTSPQDVANHVVNNAREVKYKVPVTMIDTRPSLTFFKIAVRTSDFVELYLEGHIEWQVVDVPKMIGRTGDPKGDVWFQTQSAFIEVMSKVSLTDFMANYDDIVTQAENTDVEYYEQRGLRLINLEVARYECSDKTTAKVLQEITQETTNRINRLEKQQSENEVANERMKAEIDLEAQRAKFVEMETANEKLRAKVQGEAEGLRLAQRSSTFFENLSASIPDGASRLELLRFFTEQNTLTEQTKHLSDGDATLFLTPQDVNLKMKMSQAA